MRELLDRPELLTQMERAARKFAHPGAAKEIADWVVELGKKS